MDFEMIFNELSAVPPAQDIFMARQRLSEFIKTLNSINVSGVKKVLHTHLEFHDTKLAPNYLLAQWRNDPKVDKEEQRFLRTLIANGPPARFLSDLLKNQSGTFEFQWEGNVLINPNNQICGLGAAYLLDSLAISFFSDTKSDTPQLSLQIEKLDEEGNLEKQTVSIRHASRVAHVESHHDWINDWLKSRVENGDDLWERRTKLFPHLSFCERVRKQVALLDYGNLFLPQVVKRLFELERYSQTWQPGTSFDMGKLSSKATPESDSRHDQLKDQLTFLCPDDEQRFFNFHIRFTPGAGRIYFYPKQPGEIIIGYIGEKLKKQ